MLHNSGTNQVLKLHNSYADKRGISKRHCATSFIPVKLLAQFPILATGRIEHSIDDLVFLIIAHRLLQSKQLLIFALIFVEFLVQMTLF